MPEFTDACSEICSTQEPRNAFSFSKIHHQVMNIFFCLVSNSCRLSKGCAGAAPTPLSLSLLLPKIPKAGSGDCHGASTVLGNPGRVFLLLVGNGIPNPHPCCIPSTPIPSEATHCSFSHLKPAQNHSANPFNARTPRISGCQSRDGFGSGAAFSWQGLLAEPLFLGVCCHRVRK